LGNRGLTILLDSLDPDVIESVRVKLCGLARDSVPKILSFIDRKTARTGLREFRVSKEEIPEQYRVQISQKLAAPIRAVNDGNKSLRALQKENEELWTELKRLRSMVSSVQYRDNVFVIGNDAEEFVRFMEKVEDELNRLEAQKKLMFGGA
jgi:hypothetical protein